MTCVMYGIILTSMNTPSPHQPEEVLAFLSEPLKAVYDAFDHGISWADAQMDGLEPDAHYHAHHVRYAALAYLKKLQSDGWGLGRPLKNSGIEIVRFPMVFRVFKGQHGQPPHAGRNHARRGFWNQGRLGLDFGSGVVMPEFGANLIVDWDTGIEGPLLALSMPIGNWEFQGQPKLAWRRFFTVNDTDDLRFIATDEDLGFDLRLDDEDLDQEEGLG